MKKIIFIIFLLIVSSLNAQSKNSNHSSNITKFSPSNVDNKLLVDKDFSTLLFGSIDTVWQKVEIIPELKGIITNQFFTASDGSFYFESIKFGGFVTKINSLGEIEWSINRNFSGDTSKYYTQFKLISENPNGDITVYGNEGKANPRLTKTYPIKIVLSPSGMIKEEISTRNTFLSPVLNHLAFSIYLDTKIFLNPIRMDSLLFFTLDTSFTKIQNNIYFVNDYANDPFFGIRGIKEYDNTSFLFVSQGTYPKPDSTMSMTLLKFSREYEILQRIIIHTGGVADVAVYDDGTFMVVSTNTKGIISTAKYDKTGNLLWKKEPKVLNKFALANFNLKKGKTNGFFVCGEIYPNSTDGSVNYFTDERLGYIIKLNDEGECEWYYTSGKKDLRNTIQSFAEAENGDIVFVCNSLNTNSDQDTPMQITRLRPKAMSVDEQTSLSDGGITLFPNPTSSAFTIASNEIIESLKIVNSLGVEVYSQNQTINKQVIDISNLSNGLYFVKIHSAKQSIIKPLIINR